MTTTGARHLLRRIAAESLYVSTPDPRMFGNERNPAAEKARQLGWTAENWLTSRFHFAFAEHRSGRGQFGALRVLNDDLVQPARGFGTHPHGDMEIVTCVINGELTHQDSMGTMETIGRGSVQFMTAGTGVRHSEHNRHDSEPLRFLQIWILPRKRGLTPNYGQFCPADGDEFAVNAFRHIVSDADNGAVSTPVTINQDLNLFSTLVEPGESVEFDVQAGRQVYLVQVEGRTSLRVDGGAGGDDDDKGAVEMLTRDAADFIGPGKLVFTAPSRGEAADNALIVILEMAQG